MENKEPAVERFVELMQDALRRVPVRKKTRVSKGAKLRRLEEKKQHSIAFIDLKMKLYWRSNSLRKVRKNPPLWKEPGGLGFHPKLLVLPFLRSLLTGHQRLALPSWTNYCRGEQFLSELPDVDVGLH